MEKKFNTKDFKLSGPITIDCSICGEGVDSCDICGFPFQIDEQIACGSLKDKGHICYDCWHELKLEESHLLEGA